MNKVIVAICLLLLTSVAVLADTHRVYFDFEIDQEIVTSCKLFIDAEVSNGDTLEFYICSPGGLVSSSIDLYNYLCGLKTRKIKVITYASGICASGGTIVLQAGDVRIIDPCTMFLVHKAYRSNYSWHERIWVYFFGDKDLDYTNDLIYNLFAVRSKRNYKEVKKDFSFDHWMRGDEVIDKGYADKYGRYKK